MNGMKRILFFVSWAVVATVSSCMQEPRVVGMDGCCIPVLRVDDCSYDSVLVARIESGRKAVDSIKAPLIGTASMTLKAYRPESPLMNFAADALLSAARSHCNVEIDIAITNKGGLRSEIAEGAVTFGDIYNVFPFDNTLVLITLDGRQLTRLFSEIAVVGGEPISGATITMTRDGRVADAKVGGRPVDPERLYRIATSDYLSQGNDGMTTLAEGRDKDMYSVTIRDLMVEYISALHGRGKPVTAKEDGRITITEN